MTTTDRNFGAFKSTYDITIAGEYSHVKDLTGICCYVTQCAGSRTKQGSKLKFYTRRREYEIKSTFGPVI